MTITILKSHWAACYIFICCCCLIKIESILLTHPWDCMPISTLFYSSSLFYCLKRVFSPTFFTNFLSSPLHPSLSMLCFIHSFTIYMAPLYCVFPWETTKAINKSCERVSLCNLCSCVFVCLDCWYKTHQATNAWPLWRVLKCNGKWSCPSPHTFHVWGNFKMHWAQNYKLRKAYVSLSSHLTKAKQRNNQTGLRRFHIFQGQKINSSHQRLIKCQCK